MKAQIRPNKDTLIEVEAGSQKELFKAIASAHEVFGIKSCALCGSTDVIPAWRTVTVVKGKKTETYEYPEYHCQGRTKEGRRCGARLGMGTINDDTGTLYPNRKLLPNGQPVTKEDREKGVTGEYGPHQGWHRFRAEPEKAAGGESEAKVAF